MFWFPDDDQSAPLNFLKLEYFRERKNLVKPILGFLKNKLSTLYSLTPISLKF